MPEFEVIGVLSLPDRLGTGGFTAYRDAARRDLGALQQGGVNTVLIENSGESATSAWVPRNTLSLMRDTIRALKSSIWVPFLVGALPADYNAALELAEEFGAKGIWMDTLVDPVSPKYLEGVEIRIGEGQLHLLRVRKGDKLVYAEVQPRNFYRMLEERPLEESVRRAKEHADAICIVGENGPPEPELIEQARAVATGKNIGISGGLNAENIGQYVGRADFGVVFSSIRIDGKAENPVDPDRVGAFMDSVRRVA